LLPLCAAYDVVEMSGCESVIRQINQLIEVVIFVMNFKTFKQRNAK
jgi:hypothetical protein